MKVGILGAGGIAIHMANTLNGMETAEAYAVASRNGERAELFAKEHKIEKAYGSYEALLNDPEVDLVYIATPHSHHFEQAKLCLEHGKPVLVEKAFTANARQARELIALAEEKQLLVAEALWTRYMPSRKMINDLLDEAVIGKATSLTANLGYPVAHVNRLNEPELAGGALLDLGVYPINFAMMAFGDDFAELTGEAVLTEKGVDARNSMTMTWADGRMAVLHTNMAVMTDRLGAIFGDKGYLEVQNINNCEEIRVYDLNRELVARHLVPQQITGYEYQVESCRKAIAEGKIECPEMPHATSLKVMIACDALRERWGVRFPFD